MPRLLERRFAGSSVGGLGVVRRARKVGGDLTAPNTAGAWQLVSGTDIDLPAVVGDYVELSFTQMASTTASLFLDWAVVVSAAPVRAASSETSTPLTEGLPGLYPQFRIAAGPFGFVATADDISGGVVKFQLLVKAAGSGTIYRSSTYPIILTARNFGAGIDVS